MRKSLFVCLMMFAAFSAEKVSAYYGNQFSDLFGIRKSSLEFNVGYRTDEFEWRFKDPQLGSLLQTVFDLLPITGELPTELEALFDFLEASGIGDLVDNAFGFKNTYESHWKHLRMVNVGFLGKLETCCGIYGRADANYGWVCNGKYQPRGAFSGSTEFLDGVLSNYGVAPSPRKHVKGHIWDVTAGIGYNFKFCCDSFQLAPMIGWSYYNTDLRTYTDRSSVDVSASINLDFMGEGISMDLGRFFAGGEANASYSSYWTGPWVGFDANYQYDCNWSLFTTFEYHYSRHIGKGHAKSTFLLVASDVFFEELDPYLNLDDAFITSIDARNRFKNHISMQGYKIGGGINYTINDCWYAGFKVDYWNMRKARNDSIKVRSEGELFVFVDDGGDEEIFSADLDPGNDFKLTKIRWESLRFEIQLGLNF